MLLYWFRQRIYFGVEQLWMLQAAGQHHTRTGAPRGPNRLTWKLSRRQNGGFIIFFWWFLSKCLNFHVAKFWITLITFYFMVHSIRTFYDFVDLLMIHMTYDFIVLTCFNCQVCNIIQAFGLTSTMQQWSSAETLAQIRGSRSGRDGQKDMNHDYMEMI